MTLSGQIVGITLLVLAHTVVAQQCQKWCATNEKTWANKCTWNNCRKCSECAAIKSDKSATSITVPVTTESTTSTPASSTHSRHHGHGRGHKFFNSSNSSEYNSSAYSYGAYYEPSTTTPRPHGGCENRDATILGYSQLAWDNDNGRIPQPASTGKKWAKLTREERMAAEDLGYTAASWERTPGWYGPYPEHAHKGWSKLAADEKNAFLVLGYDEASYEDIHAEMPPADIKIWVELTDKEREAATFLGYDQKMWDDCYPVTMFKKWAKFTVAERAACAALGYTEETWDHQPEKHPIRQKYWSQLTDAQKKAARAFGHNPESWDNKFAPKTATDKYKWKELSNCFVGKDVVCGSDGKQYINTCYAKCAKVKVWTRGKCTGHPGDPGHGHRHGHHHGHRHGHFHGHNYSNYSNYTGYPIFYSNNSNYSNFTEYYGDYRYYGSYYAPAPTLFPPRNPTSATPRVVDEPGPKTTSTTEAVTAEAVTAVANDSPDTTPAGAIIAAAVVALSAVITQSVQFS